MIHESEMLVVKKIFHLAAEGCGMVKILSHLYAQGTPSPKGAPVWDRRVVHDLVMNDIYRPHTFAEIATLVAPEVAARLDPNKEYGIRWHNKYVLYTPSQSRTAVAGDVTRSALLACCAPKMSG